MVGDRFGVAKSGTESATWCSSTSVEGERSRYAQTVNIKYSILGMK